jgi:Tfp pilus assembly protein PilN
VLLMIRINLLGRAKGQKGGKRSFALPRIPNVGLLLALLILVIEGAVAFQWSQQAAENANKLESKARKLKEEVDDYTKIKTEVDELKHKLEDGNKEKLIFDELFAQKIGPSNALTYLAFILAPRKEAEVPGDELKQMELAGWRVNWPGEKARAWLTAVHEKEGEVTLIGGAVDHGDVAEVARRLESSAHFREMKLVSQERKIDPTLGVPYIEFTIRGALIYLLDPYKPAGETPEAPAEAAAEGDATSGADGDATSSGETTGMLKSNLLPPPDAAVGEVDAGDADVQKAKEEPDTGPPPIVPTPVAPRAEPEPARQPATPPLIEHAVEPPPAERGADPSDPGAGATAQPAEPSNPYPTAPAGNP